jgi:sugar phosphate permease
MGKTYALVFGWLFVVLGVLGFFSNSIVGGASGAWFAADTNHNIVHLLSGLILLWAGYKARARAGSVMKVLGVVYVLIAILGFFMTSDTGSLLGLVQVNHADHYLHLVLGILLFIVGLRSAKRVAPQQAM